MIRLAVLVAWAELYVSSTKQKYLEQVVEPHLNALSELWINTLRDYSEMKVDSEWLVRATVEDDDDGETPSTFKSMYSASSLQVLTSYYDDSWSVIMNAVSLLISNEHETTIRRLEYSPSNAIKGASKGYNMLLGLSIEKLSSRFGMPLDTYRVCISMLDSLLKPYLLKNHFLESYILQEVLEVLVLSFQVEEFGYQVEIAQLLSNFTQSFCKTFLLQEFTSVENGTFYKLLKVVVHLFATYLPEFKSQLKYKSKQMMKELTRSCSKERRGKYRKDT
jgi:hypothetical protein